jgi:Tol biopolymer transport system component
MNSQSSNLASGDYDDDNGFDDIFLRDRMTGTTTRISRSSDGGSGDGISQMGTISTNGRHVAFASGSTNLVPGDTNNHWDVFVRDLDQQRTVRVSVATDGTQGDRDAYYPSLSADGRFVAFVSWATTFAPGVSSSAPRQMYLHDRDADSDGVFDEPDAVMTELISVGLTGGIANDSVDSPRVSSDGRHVLFESAATNLSDVGNPNTSNHLYLRDRLTSQTALIDRAMTGGPSSWGVGYGTSDMTDDGQFITFSSFSPDIVPFEMNWQSQVFRYDTVAGPAATTIVSRLPDGTVGDGSSYASSVSADGRYVVFTTAASNLASPPPGASGPAMLAVRDMLDGSFARVDVLNTGEAFDQSDYYWTAAVSADGSAIVLQSRSQGALGTAPSWNASHVFVLTGFSVDPPHAWYPQKRQRLDRRDNVARVRLERDDVRLVDRPDERRLRRRFADDSVRGGFERRRHRPLRLHSARTFHLRRAPERRRRCNAAGHHAHRHWHAQPERMVHQRHRCAMVSNRSGQRNRVNQLSDGDVHHRLQFRVPDVRGDEPRRDGVQRHPTAARYDRTGDLDLSTRRDGLYSRDDRDAIVQLQRSAFGHRDLHHLGGVVAARRHPWLAHVQGRRDRQRRQLVDQERRVSRRHRRMRPAKRRPPRPLALREHDARHVRTELRRPDAVLQSRLRTRSGRLVVASAAANQFVPDGLRRESDVPGR